VNCDSDRDKTPTMKESGLKNNILNFFKIFREEKVENIISP
jgi:hypothetical protein